MYLVLIYLTFVTFLLALILFRGIQTVKYIKRLTSDKERFFIFIPPSPKKTVINRFKSILYETALYCLEGEKEKSDILRIFIEHLPDFLKSDSWSFLLTPNKGHWTFLTWSKNLDFLPLEDIADELENEGENIRNVLESNSSLFIKNVKENVAWKQENPLTVSWLGIPIKIGDEIVGVLNIDWFKTKKFTKIEKEISRCLKIEIENVLTTVFKLNELFLNSHLDPLTEIYNRKALEDYMKNHPIITDNIALVFIDIDDFKKINDTFGHTVGDQILKTIVKRIKNVLRVEDYFFRYGGDEFILILKNINNHEDIKKIITRLQSIVSDTIIIDDYIIKSSCSMGYCLLPLETNNIQRAIEIADKKMYLQKSNLNH